MTPTEILLGLLDEAFDKKAWHGTNLRGSVRGLDARTAAWRPGPRRHNIWELAVHAAYWKYEPPPARTTPLSRNGRESKALRT
ncbi:MAG TPA: hypothetical protein VKA01_14315 [Vicinamibacteria bacterium]|nr:hypothetical protein [Vicinamibacteria bacterium]